MCRSIVSDLERQQSGQKEELEQLKKRSAEIETDTQSARDRIHELEGAGCRPEK